MTSTKYLTQFICNCARYGREIIAVEVDGEITVECNACDNGLTVIRPTTPLDAGVMASRPAGHFTLDTRYAC